jgi:membrane protease YdiL (CAAX protease family)
LEAGQKIPSDLLARFGAIIGIVQVLVIGFSLAYLANRYGHDESEFGFDFGKGQWRRGLKLGAIAFVMWVPVVWIVQTVLVMFIEYSHPSFERIKDANQVRTIIDTWISAVIVAPVVEEILFRGIIQGWLQRWRSDARANPNALILGGATIDNRKLKKRPSRPLHIPAIVITSVLFGLAHFSQGPAPISLFVLSLGIGYLYQRTGNLIACIVVHMLLNAVTMVLFSIDLFAN